MRTHEIARMAAACRRRAAVLGIAALSLAAQAAAQEPVTFSPRWMYELEVGRFYTDLDDFETFYGEDHETIVAAAGAYRIRDWLEVGAEIGDVHATGVGISPGGQGGEVDLELFPVEVFASFVYQPNAERRLVPYAGIGLAAVWYEQDVELQGERDGRTDVGPALRAGVRWLFTSQGPRSRESRRRDTVYSRSYVFLEARETDTDIDDIELGGTTYLVGFRMEFELGR